MFGRTSATCMASYTPAHVPMCAITMVTSGKSGLSRQTGRHVAPVVSTVDVQRNVHITGRLEDRIHELMCRQRITVQERMELEAPQPLLRSGSATVPHNSRRATDRPLRTQSADLGTGQRCQQSSRCTWSQHSRQRKHDGAIHTRVIHVGDKFFARQMR